MEITLTEIYENLQPQEITLQDCFDNLKDCSKKEQPLPSGYKLESFKKEIAE